MKSEQHIVTSSNSPLIVPVNYRGGDVGIAATPAGAGNYTIAFTLTPQNEGLSNNPAAIAAMTAATTVQSAVLGPSTAVIITLNSGTSVTVDVAQSDV